MAEYVYTIVCWQNSVIYGFYKSLHDLRNDENLKARLIYDANSVLECTVDSMCCGGGSDDEYNNNAPKYEEITNFSDIKMELFEDFNKKVEEWCGEELEINLLFSYYIFRTKYGEGTSFTPKNSIKRFNLGNLADFWNWNEYQGQIKGAKKI